MGGLSITVANPMPEPEAIQASCFHPTAPFVAPRNTLEIHLTKLWEAALNVQPIGVKHVFSDLGGNSLLAARLCGQIENIFGKTMFLTEFHQTPTVEQMASVLRGRKATTASSSLVAINSNGLKPPLFCIHPIGGSVHWYYDLAYHLGPDQPFYGLQAQGLDGRMPLHNSIAEMAAHYVHEIRTFQPQGPYILAGYSFGGKLAVEMVHQFESNGIEVALLALLDTHGPGFSRFRTDASVKLKRTDRLHQMINRHLNALKRLQLNDRCTYVWERINNICNGSPSRTRLSIKKKISNIAYKYSRMLGLPLPLALRDFKNIHSQLNQEHKKTHADLTQVYRGRVVLFRAIDQPPAMNPDPTNGWAKVLLGKFEIFDVPGDHGTIIKEPNVQVLAQKFRACIEQVCSAESNTQKSGRSPSSGATRDYLHACVNADEQMFSQPHL
jgi:thioesterase domain-containing protein